MAKYFLTNKAVEDLSHIWNYTYETWSENQADKYYQLIIEACGEIAEKLLPGKSYEALVADIFGCKVGKHIIFYRILPVGDIEVIRILHGSMDIERRLND